MLESSEAEIAGGVVALRDAGIRAEGAAGAALAALPQLEPTARSCSIVTGRNIDDELLARCRGLYEK